MNAEQAIRKVVEARLRSMGLDTKMADNDMDLMQSGIFDSMSFIDMLTNVEEELDVRLDLENTLADPATFTFSGLTDLFNKASNG